MIEQILQVAVIVVSGAGGAVRLATIRQLRRQGLLDLRPCSIKDGQLLQTQTQTQKSQ